MQLSNIYVIYVINLPTTVSIDKMITDRIQS